MEWKGRLVGGRYDGDSATDVRTLEVPGAMWVTTWCVSCRREHGDTEWYLTPPPAEVTGVERYEWARQDDNGYQVFELEGSGIDNALRRGDLIAA